MAVVVSGRPSGSALCSPYPLWAGGGDSWTGAISAGRGCRHGWSLGRPGRGWRHRWGLDLLERIRLGRLRRERLPRRRLGRVRSRRLGPLVRGQCLLHQAGHPRLLPGPVRFPARRTSQGTYRKENEDLLHVRRTESTSRQSHRKVGPPGGPPDRVPAVSSPPAAPARRSHLAGRRVDRSHLAQQRAARQLRRPRAGHRGLPAHLRAPRRAPDRQLDRGLGE